MKRLISHALLIATAIALLCACAGSSTTGTGRACADKVAQQMLYGQSIPGLWNCLSPALQKTLNSMGDSGDDAFGGSSDSTYHIIGSAFVGESADGSEFFYTWTFTDQGKTFSGASVVFVDPKTGKVSNLDATQGSL